MKPLKMALRQTTLIPGALLLACFLGTSCSSGEEQAGHDEHGHEGEHEDKHDGEHDGEHVEGRAELTEQQLASAGIEVQTAGPGEIAEHLTLPAVVSMNADTSTHVNPKVPGLVRSIHKHLGEQVEVGDLLCTITSVELGGTVADLVLANALAEAAEETLENERMLFEQRLRTAEEVLSGAIDVNESIHEREKALQAKAVSTIRPLLEAEKALMGSRLAREQKLSDLRAEQAARLLALEVQVREKRLLADGASNKLLALGIEERLVAAVNSDSPLLAGTYEIRAARPGIVAERHLSTGEHVDEETRLFMIEDLSSVWVVASAFEQQVRFVRIGQEAIVSLNSFPGLTFSAEVSVIAFEADPDSRALGVRVELANPRMEDWPEQFPIRPGMFGSVKLVTGRRNARVAVPVGAIVPGDHGDSVFVRVEERVFEQRAVTVRPGTGSVVEILSGLDPGEDVAVTGTFLLKSVVGQEELGGGHSH